MNCNKSFFGLFLAALIILPGCMRVPTYQCKPLKLANNHCVYRDTEKNVIVQTKLLSKEDKSALFGDRSASIHNNDIQVIHLSINNLSNVKYLLSPADIDLPIMSCRDVEKLMKTSSVGRFTRGIGFGAVGAGAIGWGVTGPMLCDSIAIAYVCLPLGVVAATAALTFFGKSIKSMIMNRRISKDLKEKMLHDKANINSGDHYEGLIFVKSLDYTPQFSVQLREKNNRTHSITFDVDLRQNEQKE